ncbi:MAG: 50S ribosomal protein L6 [bacterium]|nr:50S ribosomal protein L6 [bacterium]
MSRIGKRPITLPAKTEVNISGNMLVVRGQAGELSRKLHPLIEVQVLDNEVIVTRKKETLESNALWGTFASHISNMVSGVNTPFVKKLILEGIGYKSEVKGEELHLALGFSHPVIVKIPAGLKVIAEKNVISISGIDKEEVGSFAAKVRSLKKPEPYKGKGMRYEGEVVRRKQGKKSA